MQAAMMAHIAEHLGYQYRRQIEMRLGVPLPPPDKELPEDVEVQLSKLVAEASTQLLQMNQAQAAQKQALAQAQDPMIQMAQQELQIKAQKEQREAQKDAADTQLAQERLQLERERIAVEAQKEQARLQNKADTDDKKIQLELTKTIVGKGKTK